jgi:hypothetical protein
MLIYDLWPTICSVPDEEIRTSSTAHDTSIDSSTAEKSDDECVPLLIMSDEDDYEEDTL